MKAGLIGPVGTLAVAILAIGCETASPQTQAEFFRTIPRCTGDLECKARMQAAQLWILHNLPRKIQTISDVFIETYGPGPNSAETAARVVKEPVVGDGQTYKIVITTYCNNPFGCFPSLWDAALNFNRYVNAAAVPRSAPEVAVAAPAPIQAAPSGGPVPVGTILYEPDGKPFGAVDAADPDHAFDDGSRAEAVRVKVAAGGYRWIRLASALNMMKAPESK